MQRIRTGNAPVWELADHKGSLILRRTGMHFNRKASTCIELADGRTIVLPVTGRQLTESAMKATDESGNVLVRYRFNPRKFNDHIGFCRMAVEMLVGTTALSVPNIELLLVLTSECLPLYFRTPSMWVRV